MRGATAKSVIEVRPNTITPPTRPIGGLPGDGWDGKDKSLLDGKLEDGHWEMQFCLLRDDGDPAGHRATRIRVEWFLIEQDFPTPWR